MGQKRLFCSSKSVLLQEVALLWTIHQRNTDDLIHLPEFSQLSKCIFLIYKPFILEPIKATVHPAVFLCTFTKESNPLCLPLQYLSKQNYRMNHNNEILVMLTASLANGSIETSCGNQPPDYRKGKCIVSHTSRLAAGQAISKFNSELNVFGFWGISVALNIGWRLWKFLKKCKA